MQGSALLLRFRFNREILGANNPANEIASIYIQLAADSPSESNLIRFGECAEWLIGGSALSRVYQPQTVQMAATSPLGRDANLPTA